LREPHAAVGTSLCDRRLASYRLSHLEALEFGMLQIEWPGRIVAGARCAARNSSDLVHASKAALLCHTEWEE
jgi:hypothetical protein